MDRLPSTPSPAMGPGGVRPQGEAENAMDLRKSKEGGSVGYKTLTYPLTRQNGKIRYECNVCRKIFGQLSNLKVSSVPQRFRINYGKERRSDTSMHTNVLIYHVASCH